MSWLWGPATNPAYEELVEKACSPLNLPFPQSEDISVNLEITDMIRSKAVQPKPAMQSLKRRVASKNGRVQMYAFSLIDTCIKNGGDHFLAEIASKEFVDEVSAVIRSPASNVEVKQMALRDFQNWALAFQSKKELSFFVDVYNELKNSGINFPPAPSTTSSHLLETTTAPTWVDSDVCMRCRTAFTFTNRKHHCRNCGLVFDQACSSRQMPLPRFGIAEEVRVCEGCWMKSGRGKEGPAPAVPGRTPRSRQDLDADLQRAIELSLAESQPGARNFVGSEPPLRAGTVEDDDEQLRLAIEASLRETEMARPSAPQGADEPEYKPLPTFDLTSREAETVLTFSNTMDQMVSYGERDLRRFPHAHVLAGQAYALAGKLQRNQEEKNTKQQMLHEMQAKLSEAVTLYGAILDGQQAFSARQLQEQQQRQYAQQQQMYGYTPPQQQQYSAYPNGHAAPYYIPPQSQPQTQYQPPAAAQRAGPSLYPSMPSMAAPQQYAPQPYQPPPQETYRPDSVPPQQQHNVPTASSPYANYPPQLQQQWAALTSPPSIERHSSMRVVSSATAPPAPPQRHASLSYSSAPPVAEPAPFPQGYAVLDSQPSAPPPIAITTGPPPVDMSSHPPSASPTASVHSSLPPQAQSYTSPTPAQVALPTSPAPTQAQQLYQPAHHQHFGTSPQHANTYYQQQQHQHQPYQAQPQYQQQQQHLYSAASFPAAPPAGIMFPDAPVEAPQTGLEKKEQEEALLIEL